GEDDITILLRVVKGTARRAREVKPQIPAEIDELLRRMLARSPAERPRDASVAAAALARLAVIYGEGRPGDDPLDALLTTRDRAVVIEVDEHPLGSTSPFPLTVPRGAADLGAPDDDDDDDVELITGVELVTDPSLNDSSSSLGALVAAALAAAEARAVAPA